MHNAPSVSYPAGRSRFAAALLAAVWLAGCAAAALWLRQAPFAWRPLAMCAALCAAGGFAAWQWWRSPAGVLAWDGQAWRWSAHPGEGSVTVALDLQRMMLLRWSAPGAARWLWLSRARGAQRWDDLRRAVYSRARPQAPRSAKHPAATP